MNVISAVSPSSSVSYCSLGGEKSCVRIPPRLGCDNGLSWLFGFLPWKTISALHKHSIAPVLLHLPVFFGKLFFPLQRWVSTIPFLLDHEVLQFNITIQTAFFLNCFACYLLNENLPTFPYSNRAGGEAMNAIQADSLETLWWQQSLPLAC